MARVSPRPRPGWYIDEHGVPRDSKGRTEAEHHAAWIAWRKKIVDEHFPEICSCMIGDDTTFKPIKKCCQVVACGQRVKRKYVDKHRRTCKVCCVEDAPPFEGPRAGGPYAVKELKAGEDDGGGSSRSGVREANGDQAVDGA